MAQKSQNTPNIMQNQNIKSYTLDSQNIDQERLIGANQDNQQTQYKAIYQPLEIQSTEKGKENYDGNLIVDTNHDYSPDKLKAIDLLKVPPKKEILWGQAVATAATWGVSNFFYSFMSHSGFIANCLNFTGASCVSFVWKIVIFREQQALNGGDWVRSFKYTMLKSYCDQSGQIRGMLLAHSFIRLTLFFLNSYMIITTAYYAKLAQLNLGIISSIFSLAIVFNTIVGRLLFGEKLSLSKYIGIVIIIVGVVWIAMLKGKPKISNIDEYQPTDDELTYYRVMTILAALGVSVQNACRVTQNKLVYRKYELDPMVAYTETGLTMGVICGIITLFAYLNGQECITTYNMFWAFVASTVGMCCTLLCFNCVAKGLSGPSSAIFQTQSIFQIVLESVFLFKLPTIMQTFASIFTIGGVAVMLVF
eukprot:403358778